MSKDIFGKLMAFLDRLEQGKLSYTLARYRQEALMVSVAMPGERWEVEFLEDGSVEVERFISNGDIYEAEALDALLATYSDVDEEEEATVALAST